MAGRVIPASQISDPMFAQETMGPSVGIEPSGSTAAAPFDGKVTMLFPMEHAVGFEAFVKQDDVIAKGQKLIHFDKKKIKEAGYKDTVIVVVANESQFKELKKAA